jgi:hypothetical protein
MPRVQPGECWLHLVMVAALWAALAYYDSTSEYVAWWIFWLVVVFTVIEVRCFVLVRDARIRQKRPIDSN